MIFCLKAVIYIMVTVIICCAQSKNKAQSVFKCIQQFRIRGFKKGNEKGYFDLHGSTIVLIFEEDKIELLPEILKIAGNSEEIRVKAGEFIGKKKR